MVDTTTLAPNTETPDAEIVDGGRQLIEEMGGALNVVASRLTTTFASAVRHIALMPTSARLVVTGVGKAGHVAMKVSATFASIGVPSLFLHSAEAAHGDLGRIQDGDCLVALSNSGETSEVVKLIEAVANRDVFRIAITRSSESTLARNANITVAFGVLPEAGPLNLAPTTSTLAMLALGDALCMGVLQLRGFSAEQFARYHPGGTLGRDLLLCHQVMRSGEFHCIVPETVSVREAFERYSATPGRPGAVTLVNDDGTLAGIFTDGDLRRLLGRTLTFWDDPVSVHMSRRPRIVNAKDRASVALDLITAHKIDQVIVVDDHNVPVGLVDIQDLVRLFADTLPKS